MTKFNEVADALADALHPAPDDPPGMRLDLLHETMDDFAKEYPRSFGMMMQLPALAKLWQVMRSNDR